MLPELKCPECGLKWLPRTTTGKPVRCPRCGKPYKGPVLVGVLLPCEADQFFTKIGFDYSHILTEALASYTEAWQLAELEKGKDIDRALFQESIEVLKVLGHEKRGVKIDVADEIISGKSPTPPKIWSRK